MGSSMLLSLVLHHAVLAVGAVPPARLFRQINSDHTGASLNAAIAWLCGSTVARNIEHLFRNIRHHQSEGSRLRHYSIDVVVAYIVFSAFLPNQALFSISWGMFQHMRHVWRASRFVDYLEMGVLLPDARGLLGSKVVQWRPLWFVGWFRSKPESH